jgi:hypothetical protein
MSVKRGKLVKPQEAPPFDVDDYAWLHASKLTEDADKRLVLAWFVERVRAGKKVNSAVLEFIAAGVEQHLAGKKPWAAKRGIKKKTTEQAMMDAFPIYADFERIQSDLIQHGKPAIGKRSVRNLIADAITFTAEEVKVSEDTVKRAVATVREQRFTVMGKVLYQALSDHYAMLEYLKSPEGKAWLESPAGKEWKKDSNT